MYQRRLISRISEVCLVMAEPARSTGVKAQWTLVRTSYKLGTITNLSELCERATYPALIQLLEQASNLQLHHLCSLCDLRCDSNNTLAFHT